MTNFKLLYFFTSTEIDVIEIKRTNLPSNSSTSDVYKWLVIQNKTGKVIGLTFKAMDIRGLEEFRDFEEGKLSFNQREGKIEFSDKAFELVRTDINLVSEQSVYLIQTFLDKEL